MFKMAQSSIKKVRINAVFLKESDAWLKALPIASLGTISDNETFCAPRTYKSGSSVEVNRIHGLKTDLVQV